MVASKVEGPLSGVRILDLTHVWAGPLAVRTLADLGATVVKVERPFARGTHQAVATPVGGWLGNPEERPHWNRNGVYVKLQRNRFGVALDYKTDAGRAVLLELVAQADVVVENYSANAMAGLGLSYTELSAANSKIIYVTMPGYGSTGSYSDRVAFGTVIESLSALTYMTGYSPTELYNSAQALPDAMGGMHTVAAIAAALAERERTGTGMRVELSLHESGVNISGPWLVAQQIDPQKPEAMGNRHPAMAPHGVYACLGDDQWLALACEDDSQWASLLNVLGEPSSLPKNWDLAARQQNAHAIDTTISDWTSQRTKADATDELQNAGVPAGPVNNAPEMLADEQLNTRGFYDFRDRFDISFQGDPVHRNQSGVDNWLPSPHMGEHNAEILGSWLDYSDEQINALTSSGVLVTEPPIE